MCRMSKDYFLAIVGGSVLFGIIVGIVLGAAIDIGSLEWSMLSR